jgi:hypothetical protein
LGWDRDRATIPNGTAKLGKAKTNGSLSQILDKAPDEARLARLAELDEMDREIRTRGGPGRLSYSEFQRFMKGEKGRGLAFVEQWLELGSF